ncbi:MAG TPA: hypothetical protein PKE63_09835 [Lacibacter sp.]|nr:hypothetical protein [Lacibacter sp.]HMO88596.1 hypothetical protein [Lacibacter sp.]HMP87566.1 hypothetical protein [Lacibacter sp.]
MFSKAAIEKYFNAEKAESLLFLGIGLAAVVAAVLFYFFLKTAFYKGAALPLLLMGLLVALVGYTVYARSDADRIRNVYAFDMNPTQLKEQEIPRMETVMRNFKLYRYSEIVLAVTGLLLFVYFRNNSGQAFWCGLGVALFIMALMALGADYFAERRGAMYLEGLNEFVRRGSRGA